MSRTVGPHERNVTSLRRLNAAECITVLRDGVAVSVSEIARVTGLSRPTVEAVLADLTEQQLAEVDQSPQRGAGRPARVYRFRADAGHVAGIDIGLHSVRVLVADLAGQVRSSITRPSSPDLSGVQRLEEVRAAVDDALAAAGLGRHDLLAVAAGVPGIVADDGRVTLSQVIPDWTGVDVGARIGAVLPCPVLVENDINLAVTAEHRLGAARLADDVVYILVGHRVSVGLVLGGRLHRGRHGGAGEVGTVIGSVWSEGSAADGNRIWLTADSAEEMFALAAAGDPAAATEIEEFARQLAPGVASLALTVDPDVVVIGGGLSQGGALLLDPLRRFTAASTRVPFAPNLVVSELGAESVVLGGLVRAYEYVSEHLYGSASVPTPAIRRVPSPSASRVVERPSAAPVAVPPPLGARPDDRELLIGVVGVGARSTLAAWANRRESHARVVAVADPRRSAAQRAKELFGSAVEVYPSHRDLCALGLDAVFVTSPDDTHADIADDLLVAGIPVFLEKPLSTSTGAADRVLATAFRTGTRLYVGHNMRHMSVVRTMKGAIDRGEIGEVKAVWCRHFVGNGGDYYFKDWHADRSRSTGLLLQKGAHDLDVIHYLAGAYTRDVVGMGDLAVYGRIADRRDNSDRLMPDWFSLDHWPPLSQRELNPVIDVEDISMVAMRLTNGVTASYEQCHFTPDYWRNYTVIGTEGRLENFGDGDGAVVRVWNRRTAYHADGDLVHRVEGDSAGHDDADELTVNEFLHFVRTGGPVVTSPVAARYAVATGIAATESIRDGSTPRVVVPLDPSIESYFEQYQKAPAHLA